MSRLTSTSRLLSNLRPSIGLAATVFALSFVTATPSAFAQANVMKECGAEYQTAKAANSLNGQKWPDFLSACRTRHAAATPTAAPTAPAAPAPKPSTATAPPTTPPATSTAAAPPATGGRAAMLERQRACGTEWKAQKVELRKANPALKWPQYWSECNKRMKAAAKQ